MPINVELLQLPEPMLEFGGSGEFIDPKEGLLAEGPFSLRFGSAQKAQTRVGLVGPKEAVDAAYAWFEACRVPIASGIENQKRYPDFPGFEATLRSRLELSPHWTVEIADKRIQAMLRENSSRRFQSMLDAYAQAVQNLSDRDNRPDVVLCCLTTDIVRHCSKAYNTTLPEQVKSWARIRRSRESGQLSLFDEAAEETADDLLFRDFRRALKARAMHARIPIQIVTPKLLADTNSQDKATRAWNVCVALFYKAGGIPWRLKTSGPETCFVGVSFHHLKTSKTQLVYSSLAQAFSSEGDGFALRGDFVPWDSSQGRHPHLTVEQARNLVEQVLGEYRERTGRTPARLVVHKTSQYNEAEREGFTSVLDTVPIIELVNAAQEDFRLLRGGSYPPKRGLLCRVNGDHDYLFTTGYVPEWETFPGPHIPVPLRIMSSSDDSIRVASDVLALTRMNWNTVRNTSGIPITLRFAREVGGIMAEVGPKEHPNPSYRYYM